MVHCPIARAVQVMKDSSEAFVFHLEDVIPSICTESGRSPTEYMTLRLIVNQHQETHMREDNNTRTDA